jgi:hypothetical protein
MPLQESCAIGDLGNTTMNEEEWRNDISQTLAETPENSTLSSKCRDLQSRLVSILMDISDKRLLATHAPVDDVYAQIMAQIESSQASKRTRTKGFKTHTGRKRKRKRYIYATMQDLFRKNPNLLARYIREGIPWL